MTQLQVADEKRPPGAAFLHLADVTSGGRYIRSTYIRNDVFFTSSGPHPADNDVITWRTFTPGGRLHLTDLHKADVIYRPHG